MIMKRSSHMPTFTTIAIVNSDGGLARIDADHSACGMIVLHRMTLQKTGAYGPANRFRVTAMS